jgi:hypothetical protein
MYLVKLFMGRFMRIVYSISHKASKQVGKIAGIMSHENFTKDLIARLESLSNVGWVSLPANLQVRDD